MLEQYAEPTGGQVLVELDLEPSQDFLHKGHAKGRAEQAAIETLTGRRNLVLVGVPQVVDLFSVWPAEGEIASEIESLRQQDREFHALRLACSFIPDRGCRFLWARLKVDLVGTNGGAEDLKPIAFDLFPRMVERVEQYRRTFKILPTFKFAFGEISTEVAGEREGLRYVPQIVAAGLLTSTPMWTFQTTARQGIDGGYDLFLLVQRPRGAPVHARFLASAEVGTHLGRVPLGRYRDPALVDRTFPLVP